MSRGAAEVEIKEAQAHLSREKHGSGGMVTVRANSRWLKVEVTYDIEGDHPGGARGRALGRRRFQRRGQEALRRSVPIRCQIVFLEDHWNEDQAGASGIGR